LGAFLCLVAGVLYFWEVEPLELSEKGVFPISREGLWEAATDLSNVNVWFSWLSSISPVDGLPLGLEKVYKVAYKLPLGLLEYSFLVTVTKYQKKRILVIEGNNFFSPQLTAVFSEVSSKKPRSSLYLSLVFRRRSALWNASMGTVLRVVGRHQLKQSLVILQILTANM